MNRQKLIPLQQKGFWRYFAVVSILATAYFGAAKIAFSILDLDIDPSPFWPPAGLALAILIVEGRMVWPGVALGSFFFCRSLDIPEIAAFGIAIGSTVQAVVGSELLHKMRFRPSLERLRDVLQLVVLGVWISPIINATISTIAAYLTHSLHPHTWQENWLILWLGDGMGILIVTPVLLVLSQAILEVRSPSFNWAILTKAQIWSKLNDIALIPKSASSRQEEDVSQHVEALVCFTWLSSISWIVFSSKTTMGLSQYPLEYLPFPFVVWAALRFGQQGAVTATLIVCLGAIWGTAQGVGPFVAKTDDIQQAILFLHGFMGVITITALVLAAAETERASAVDLLKEREASLANAQRLAQLGNWDYYEMCHAKPIPQPHLRWSDELYRLFGFMPGDVAPSWEAFFEVVHPGDRERVGQAIRDALRDNQPYCLDYRIVRPDGTERVVCEQSAIHENGISGTIQDITERQQVEAQLRAAVENVREASERQRLLGEMALRIRRSLHLNQILDTTVAEVRQFLQAHRVFIGQIDRTQSGDDCPLRGLVIAESVDSAYPPLCRMVIDDQTTLQEWRSLFVQGRAVVTKDTREIVASPRIAEYHTQYHVRAVLGVPIWLGDELYGALVVNQCDRSRQWQSWEIDWLTSLATQVAIAIQQAELYRQITELNTHLESQVEERTQELSAKMAELQELNHLKDVFLQAVSHDLRTSLLGMSMVLNNLNQSSGDAVTLSRPLLNRMVASSERQVNLINSLLEDHFNENRLLDLRCESVQIDPLIQNLIADWQPMLTQNRATLTYNPPADFPSITADPVQVRRVLENLLTNALKHNPPGLNLTLQLTADENMIRCILQDDGLGMSPQQTKNLFKLYIRGLHNQHLTGIGLGLYQCRQIITAHQGEIGAISEPGGGSTFWFTLPRTQSQVLDPDPFASGNHQCALSCSQSQGIEA